MLDKASERIRFLYDRFNDIDFPYDIKESRAIAIELRKATEEMDVAMGLIRNDELLAAIGYKQSIASAYACINEGLSTLDSADAYTCLFRAFMGEGLTVGVLGIVEMLNIKPPVLGGADESFG